MGLEKEIHELFERIIELDLERIARSAMPTYHWTTTPPPAMCEYQKPGPGSVTLESQDYQIVSIVLNPFRANDAALEQNLLRAVIERRKRRGLDPAQPNVEPTKFDEAVNKARLNQGTWNDAYHEYLEESDAQDPISIYPRDIDTATDPQNPRARVICVGGVDYVLANVETGNYPTPLSSQQEYRKVEPRLKFPPRGSIDQWPEEIVIRDNGPDGDLTYVRADVSYYDAAGNKVNHRLSK